MWRCSTQVAAIRLARTGPMPGTSVRRSGVVVDDREGRLAEGVDDPPGHDRADPLDQPAAEVPLHPLERGRERGAVVERLELPAVLGVVAPPAVGDDRLAGREVGERADDGDQASSPCAAPASASARSGASRATV